MLKSVCFILLIINSLSGYCQPKTMVQIKTELEKSPNSPLYVKDILKKKFKLDTVVVTRTAHFNSLADSLAYTGIIKKVYGPFTMQGQKFLVQILARLPNTFYRISQIFIDTSVFRYRMADSLGNSILGYGMSLASAAAVAPSSGSRPWSWTPASGSAAPASGRAASRPRRCCTSPR